MIGLEGQIEGADEIRSRLQAMGPAGKKLMRKALREGAKITAAQLKEDAPVRTGATQDAVKVKAGKRSRSGISMLAVIGAGWFRGDTFYAAFVNFGHKIGKRLQRGKGAKLNDKRAAVAGTFWMNEAFKKSRQAAADKITAVLMSGVGMLAKGKADDGEGKP